MMTTCVFIVLGSALYSSTFFFRSLRSSAETLACLRHSPTAYLSAIELIVAPVTPSTPRLCFSRILPPTFSRASWPTPIVSRFFDQSIFSILCFETVTATVMAALCAFTL